jgi:hypothetical protein
VITTRVASRAKFQNPYRFVCELIAPPISSVHYEQCISCEI